MDRKKIILAMTVSILTLTPNAFANAIVPALQFFHPYLAVPSAILLIVIIAIETVILKFTIKDVTLSKSFLIILIANIISSIAGSLFGFLGYSVAFDDFFWSSIIVTIGLPFIVTFATEYPAILFFCRKQIRPQKALWVTFKVNVVSYVVFLFLMTPVFLTGISKMSERADNKLLIEWSHKEILGNNQDDIYVLGETDHNRIFEFKKYSTQTEEWKVLKTFDTKDLSFNGWDVSDNLLAYCTNDSVEILNLSDFSNLTTIPMDGYRLQISPDEKHIAIQKYICQVNVQKKGKSWFNGYGAKCKLYIYEISSGNLVKEYDNFITSDGLSWSNDSQKLLMVSFENQELFNEIIKDDARDPEDYRIGDVFLKEFYPKFIYSYDINTGTAKKICLGTMPNYNPANNQFSFVRDENIYLHDFSKGEDQKVCRNYFSGKFKWSVSGENILGHVRTNNPMWTNKFFFTAINLDNPELKYIAYTTEGRTEFDLK